MGHPKHLFSPFDNDLACFAKALALPVRISIMRIMVGHDDWLTVEAFQSLPLTSESIVRNLHEMKLAGLIKMKAVCKVYFYRLDQDKLELFSEELAQLLHLSCKVNLTLPPNNFSTSNENTSHVCK